ncbi:Alpha/Beta hydrolase protein [Amylostereum chailletii]|nr:Alpha/Beta hydrolase protein [Amylostereum chailletii]
MELGPCRVAENGTNTFLNPYSWTEHANIIFLDQPVGVGFSYSDHNSTIETSPVAGQDVYAFLQLFLERHPKYATLPFHIAAESYGGTYAPHFASIIHRKNKELPEEDDRISSGLRKINLASVILANGFTSPYLQLGATPEYACNGPYPLFEDPDGAECESLRNVTASCQALIKRCYEDSRDACSSASVQCWTDLLKPIADLGLNPNDVRKQCEPETNGEECYKEILWIDEWMLDTRNRVALGVDADRVFERCSGEVLERFLLSGDCMHNTALLLPELIEGGIRLLVYNGNADFLCHYMGSEHWMNALEHPFHDEFVHSQAKPWVLANGQVAGEFRSAGGEHERAGNVSFVTVYDAGCVLHFLLLHTFTC